MFFEKLFGKIRLLSLVMTITVVIKVPNSGEPFFIKIDLERSDLTLKRYLKLFKKSSNWMKIFFPHNKTTRCSHSK